MKDLLKPYYQESGITLFMGDCISVMSTFPKSSVDMIFADPPYFLSNGTFTCKNGKMVSVKKGEWDMGGTVVDNLKFHLSWLKVAQRVLSDKGTLWVSGTYHSIFQCGFLMQRLGFHILNDIVWFKPNASPNLSCRFFTASHETLIWAKKSRIPRHTFNYDQMVEWEDMYKKRYQCAKCGRSNNKPLLHEKGKQMRSVWAITTPAGIEKKHGKHPTQKPLELLERIVVASTEPSSTILDPFCGSSTTGVAAMRYGRKYIGIDTEKKYLDLSIKRLKDPTLRRSERLL